MMSQGAGTLPMFPESCKLIESLYSPALGRISPPPSADAGTFYATDFLVAGDSSLAMCWMQGRRCLRKITIGPTLSDITNLETRMSEKFSYILPKHLRCRFSKKKTNNVVVFLEHTQKN